MPTSLPPLDAVDDGDVAVTALGEARERGARLDVGTDRVGVGGHPLGDLGGRRVGARGGEADHVALGQDADRAVVVVDDDDRPDLVLAHALRGERDSVSAGCAVTTGRLMRSPTVRSVATAAILRRGRSAASPWRPAPAANRAAPAARFARPEHAQPVLELDLDRVIEAEAPLLVARRAVFAQAQLRQRAQLGRELDRGAASVARFGRAGWRDPSAAPRRR